MLQNYIQVNLEYLDRVVFSNKGLLYPDTVVGTDSHTMDDHKQPWITKDDHG